MKKFIAFIPSILVCAAVIYAMSVYDGSDTEAALKGISEVKDYLSQEESSAAVQFVPSEQASNKKPTGKKIKTGKSHRNTVRKKTVQTAAAPVEKKSLTITGYNDGVFTGQGTGFNGGTTIATVTIKGGKIVDVSFKNQDTAQFFEKALKVIRPEILSNGSKPVDTVSGATYSSNGIIESVSNALKKAGVKNTITVKKNTTVRKNKNPSKKKTVKRKNSIPKKPVKKIKDLDVETFVPGTYKAVAICGPDPEMPLWDAYTISYIVTIAKDGKITASTPIGSDGYTYDDKEYLEKARDGMIPLLLSQNFFDTNISVITGSSIHIDSDIKADTISGATYSSKAITEAFVNALRQAVRK